MPIFDAYIMVDWSGASRKTHPGKDSIWYCLVVRENGRAVVRDVQNPRTRQDAYDRIFHHLVSLHRQELITLVGFDFPYSFPHGFVETLRLGGNTVESGSIASLELVTPAKAGVQKKQQNLDSGFRRNDGESVRFGRSPLKLTTLGLKVPTPWLLIWDELLRVIQDAPDNANNRFQAASRVNERITRGPGPFWCCPRDFETPYLRSRKDPYTIPKGIGEYRIAEARARTLTKPGPHSVWQLYTQGSVGSQALLGIPRVRALRFAPELESISRVWPFETGLTALKRPGRGEWSIMHAEIYPSLYKIPRIPGRCLDEMQVRTVALHFEQLDSLEELAHLFGGECDLTVDEQQTVVSEEGWILGLPLRGGIVDIFVGQAFQPAFDVLGTRQAGKPAPHARV